MIGIDISSGLKFCGGVTNYIRNLISHIPDIDYKNSYFLYLKFFKKKGKDFEFFSDFYSVHKNRLPDRAYQLLKTYLPINPTDILPKDLALIHFPDHYSDVGKRYNGKIIVTIHDLFVYLCPEYMNKDTVRAFTKSIKRSVDCADKIITVSEASKRDIVSHFGIEENRVAVIYNGFDSQLFRLNKLSYDERKRKKIPQRYILTVGEFSPRKNIEGIIKAFELVRPKYSEYKLVIAGKRGANCDGIFKLYENSRYKNDIIFWEMPSDLMLSTLYQCADVFLLPSFYEGFGIPVIEAMACGTPVITSNISSLPEIGGDAAIYADPYSVENMADELEGLLGDEAKRDALIVAGLKRSSLFSWKKMTEETVSIYENLLKV